jgi:hypothetical protein
MTRRDARTAAARGSTLLLAVVLLGVLSVIGVAAVSLASQERTNAGVKAGRDRLAACASAAQAKIWEELLRYGPSFLGRSGKSVPSLTLPDGSRLMGGHYRDPDVVVVDSGVRATECKPLSTEDFVDLTNRDTFFSLGGSCFLVTARCKDAQDRELEVEFGLNMLFQ